MVNNIVYVATDGMLDDLARKSIAMAQEIYVNENPKIYIISLDERVPITDPIFDMLGPENNIERVVLTEKDLIEVVPNVMTKQFPVGDGTTLSHWENSKSKNQHLAEFSDLAMFWLMKKQPDLDFLYMDSDMLPLQPLFCEKSFVVAMDEGENQSLYINSSLLFAPSGFVEVKDRWIQMLENEILDKYHFRYGMVGPVIFDKFMNRPEVIRKFKLDVLPKHDVNPISFTEMYTAVDSGLDKGEDFAIEIAHEGPLLNIPRSAAMTCLTHRDREKIQLLLGITNPKTQSLKFMDVMFYPKNITGIEYYDRLRSELNKEK